MLRPSATVDTGRLVAQVADVTGRGHEHEHETLDHLVQLGTQQLYGLDARQQLLNGEMADLSRAADRAAEQLERLEAGLRALAGEREDGLNAEADHKKEAE
jgi:hypothetical protein